MIGLARVGLDQEVGQDLAQEQPGAEAARDEIGVLALPADAGPLRERLLQERCRVHEHLDLAAEVAVHPARDLLEPALEDAMIVAVAGIDRDAGAVRLIQHRQGIVQGRIVERADDGAPGRGPEASWRRAPRGLAGEPVHPAVPAEGEEATIGVLDLARQRGRGEADLVETHVQRMLAQPLAVLGG
jgi:hypothetical protein